MLKFAGYPVPLRCHFSATTVPLRCHRRTHYFPNYSFVFPFSRAQQGCFHDTTTVPLPCHHTVSISCSNRPAGHTQLTKERTTPLSGGMTLPHRRSFPFSPSSYASSSHSTLCDMFIFSLFALSEYFSLSHRKRIAAPREINSANKANTFSRRETNSEHILLSQEV
jgi:hypothetical protein